MDRSSHGEKDNCIISIEWVQGWNIRLRRADCSYILQGKISYIIKLVAGFGIYIERKIFLYQNI